MLRAFATASKSSSRICPRVLVRLPAEFFLKTKAIRPGHVDANGTFRLGLKGAKAILYNLVGLTGRPGVLESNFVLVVEGENKVEALAALGLCATCNTGGAGKWK